MIESQLRAKNNLLVPHAHVWYENWDFTLTYLHEVVDGERFRKLPKCNHCFRVNCIDIWLESNSTCPLCRNQVCLVNHRQRNLGLLPQFLSVLDFFLGKIFNPLIKLEISLVLGENSRHIL